MNPIVTTIQRKVLGLTLPAKRPPKEPPSSAPAIITNATLQTTLPENTKSEAAARLAEAVGGESGEWSVESGA